MNAVLDVLSYVLLVVMVILLCVAVGQLLDELFRG